MNSLARIITVGVAVVAGPAVAEAQMPESMVGTWKLNVTRSTCSPGPCARSGTTRIEKTADGGMRMISDGISADGAATHRELISKCDGTEAEFKGSAPLEMRAYSRVNDRTYEWVTKVAGRITSKGQGTISADGKTRTNVVTRTNADGNALHSKSVYERQ